MSVRSDLVFDVGMHVGADTRYYLSKGFRVVAIEANPVLVAKARDRFSEFINGGLLTIEGIGIHEVDGVLPFTVNERVDEWSSFKKPLGARNNTPHHVIEVPTKPLSYFVEKHGMPFFMKVDIEGLDNTVVRQLAKLRERPRYLSMEDGGIDSMMAIYETGAREFKFANQITTRDQHGEASSGAFGEELPGPWLEPALAMQFYLANVRPPGQPPINGWWDIHARF